MEAAQDGDPVDQRLANLDPYQQWAQALSSNLRHFRAVGFDADAAAQLQLLRELTIDPTRKYQPLNPQETPKPGAQGLPMT